MRPPPLSEHQREGVFDPPRRRPVELDQVVGDQVGASRSTARSPSRRFSGAVILDQPRRQPRTVDEGYGSGVKRQVGR